MIRPLSARARGVVVPVVVVLLGFAALYPPLSWLQFQNSIECIAVGTALETRREGHWLVPTLSGATRTRKPPLATWASAVAIQPATLQEISNPAATVRDAAYVRFTREIRWPALAATCLMLAAAFDLGVTVAGWEAGLFAALAAGANLLILKYGRLATPDTQLALWVAVGNAFLARVLLRGQWWTGCIGAGLALGLAFMAKGPVGLLFSIVPIGLFVLWRRWWMVPRVATAPMMALAGSVAGSAREALTSKAEAGANIVAAPRTPPRHGTLAPIAVGVLLALAVALPWYALILARVPDVLNVWLNEVSRAHPADPRPDPWHYSFRFLWMFHPWTIWLLVALVSGAAVFVRRWLPAPPNPRAAASGFPVVMDVNEPVSDDIPYAAIDSTSPAVAGRAPVSQVRAGQSLVLVFLLLVVPLIVLAFFRERKDRYRQPLAVPAAVLVGWAASAHVRRWRRGDHRDRPIVWAHWIIVGAACVGTPLLLKGPGHADWPIVAGAIGAGGIVVAGSLLHARRPAALVFCTVLALILSDTAYRYGLMVTGAASSEMKPLADFVWAHYPDAHVYTTGRERTQAPADLSIYLDRTVLPRDSVADLRPDEVPQVVVVFQSKEEREPTSPLPDATPPSADAPWQKVIAFPRGSNWCHVFVLPRRG